MKRLIQIFIIFLTLLLFNTIAFAQDLEQKIDTYMAGISEDHIPGAAILISQNGKILFEKAYGSANIKTDKLLSPEMTFRIGSVSKQFTAAAIMKLIETEELAADDQLSRFYPDFARANEVTIYQLLTHTSGIHSYTDDAEFINVVINKCNADSLIDANGKKTYNFDPGTSWHYCNTAYFILGKIIEKISGKNYDEYLSETFFQPLGMKHTGIHDRYNLPSNEAMGHSYINDTNDLALDWNMSWAGGAGAIYSTVDDLNIWAQALIDGKILHSESLKLAFAPACYTNGDKAETPLGGDYGFGFIMSMYRGHRRISHGGGLHGFLSDLSMYPDDNTIIVVLGNCSPPHQIVPSMLTTTIASFLFKNKAAASIMLDDALLNALSGQYQYPNNAILTISKKETQLFAQLTGQPAFEIFPTTKTEWHWEVVNATITFKMDQNGNIGSATHSQNGSEFEVARIQ
ncbi:serine hydrolase [bacterium]|nr:serine hydrolase [bacterium]